MWWYTEPSANCSYSKPGSNRIYQFDEMGVYCYYHSHLDRYVERLREKMQVERRGRHRFCRIDRKCGCAHASLTFCHLRVGPDKAWGKAINPCPGLVAAVKRAK
jgi:hypothetical protein